MSDSPPQRNAKRHNGVEVTRKTFSPKPFVRTGTRVEVTYSDGAATVSRQAALEALGLDELV
ncbi:MAG: hypothetical protein AAFZ07_00215 [Actinomycetota bacterium]